MNIIAKCYNKYLLLSYGTIEDIFILQEQGVNHE